jgi:hypothetical protein
VKTHVLARRRVVPEGLDRSFASFEDPHNRIFEHREAMISRVFAADRAKETQ